MPDMVNNTEYTLRKLEARDVFVMSKILGEIGIEEIQNCFSAEQIKHFIVDDDKNKDEDAEVAALGFSIVVKIAGVVLMNLEKCETYVYRLLSGLSGIPEDEVKTLPIDVFGKMITEVFKKEEFKDFLKPVLKLFNLAK